jgi:hypothetical protein
MRRSVSTRSTAMIATLLPALLLAILTIPLAAQAATESRAQHGFGPGYDKAHEVTINGSVQKAFSKRPQGVPGGLHILVLASQGVVDAHLGPFVTKEMQAELQSGAAVRIVGAFQKVHGKSYLLAREMTLGGHTIVLRNQNGVLLPQENSRASSFKGKRAFQPATNGGMQ